MVRLTTLRPAVNGALAARNARTMASSSSEYG
jgi:hypothetical protein